MHFRKSVLERISNHSPFHPWLGLCPGPHGLRTSALLLSYDFPYLLLILMWMNLIADCNRICEDGAMLSADCTFCECSSAYYEGRIVGEGSRLPLPNVTVSPSNNPENVLQTTMIDGR